MTYTRSATKMAISKGRNRASDFDDLVDSAPAGMYSQTTSRDSATDDPPQISTQKQRISQMIARAATTLTIRPRMIKENTMLTLERVN